MIHTGDRVQSYSYGRPYRAGTVLSMSMGRAEVKLDNNGGTTWIETDFLTKIN